MGKYYGMLKQAMAGEIAQNKVEQIIDWLKKTVSNLKPNKMPNQKTMDGIVEAAQTSLLILNRDAKNYNENDEEVVGVLNRIGKFFANLTEDSVEDFMVWKRNFSKVQQTVRELKYNKYVLK